MMSLIADSSRRGESRECLKLSQARVCTDDVELLETLHCIKKLLRDDPLNM